MEIIPERHGVAINAAGVFAGRKKIEETQNNIKMCYAEFQEINSTMSMELTGNTKTAFESVSQTMERQIKNACGTWNKVSATLEEHISNNKKINEEAGFHAGGNI